MVRSERGSPSPTKESRQAPGGTGSSQPKSFSGKTWLRRLLLLAAGLGSIAITMLVGFLLWPRPHPQPTLADVWKALELGDPSRAWELLGQVPTGSLGEEVALGTIPFLRGKILIALSDEYRGVRRRELLSRAAHALGDAIKLGLKPPEERQARTLLAKVAYQLGNLGRVREVLTEEEVLRLPEAEWPELALLYADAWAKENPERVRRFVEACLERADLPSNFRGQLFLRQAWVLARTSKWEEAVEICRKIDRNSPYFPRAKLLEGLILVAQRRQERGPGITPKSWANQARPAFDERLTPAVLAFGEAIRWDNLTCRVTPEALYWLGTAQAEGGDRVAARETWQSVVDRFGPSPPGVAAAWALGELALQEQNSAAAREWFGRAIRLCAEAVPPRGFQLLDWDQWMLGPQFEAEVLRVYRHFLDSADFSAALSLAESSKGVLDDRVALRMQAEAYRKAGEHFSAQAPPVTAKLESSLVAAKVHAEAPVGVGQPTPREYFRLAGRTFLTLAARSYTDREYPDYLWMAAECFRKGRSARGVLHALAHYLDDQPIRRRPWALLYRGEALLALGQVEEGLRDLEACYANFPRDSAAFEARLLAAQALREMGKLDDAEKLLRRNLDGQDLAPASKEWRQSLMDLGELLLAKGNTHAREAAELFAEVVQRYPDHPQAVVAAYLWGYATLVEAQGKKKAAQQEPLPAVAAEERKKAQELFRQAAEILAPLHARLRGGTNLGLAPTEQELLLRNVQAAELLAQIGAGNIVAANSIAQQLLLNADENPELAILAAALLAEARDPNHERPNQQSGIPRLVDQLRDICGRLNTPAAQLRLSPNVSFWNTLIDQMSGS